MTGLLSLALGRPTPARPGASWSELKFGPALLKPPALDVALKIGALDTPAGTGRAAAARLRMDRDRLALDDVAMALNGGQASGRLSLRRDSTLTTASGALALQGVALERPNAKGRFDVKRGFRRSRRHGVGAGRRSGGIGPGPGRLRPGSPGSTRRRSAAPSPRSSRRPTPMLEEKKIESLIGAELDKNALSLDRSGKPAVAEFRRAALRAGGSGFGRGVGERLGRLRPARRQPEPGRDADLCQGRAVLERTAAERRGRRQGGRAQGRSGAARRRPRLGGDRARERQDREFRGRRARARDVQPAAQGRTIPDPARRRDRRLSGSAGAKRADAALSRPLFRIRRLPRRPRRPDPADPSALTQAR